MHTDTLPTLTYGIRQACQVTGLSRSFLYQQIAAGRLPTRKVGSRTLIAAADLQSWLDSYKETST
ncbi:MAG: helix-turn-helix domain-containing protein [Rhodobiaceae bacterium]|nr:helix-turn-helix domain-containing protein [Rhodobiaceae bacterium]